MFSTATTSQIVSNRSNAVVARAFAAGKATALKPTAVKPTAVTSGAVNPVSYLHLEQPVDINGTLICATTTMDTTTGMNKLTAVPSEGRWTIFGTHRQRPKEFAL